MPPFFRTINENNKLAMNKSSDSNVVYYSELNEWYTENAFRSFSIKYVVDQCIYYKRGRDEFAVDGGNLLLACKQSDVIARFNSKPIVKSICVDITSSTVEEAFTVMTAPDNPNFDNYRARYFKTPEFFESVCPVSAAPFGNKLKELATSIANGYDLDHVNEEWFLEVAEKVVLHEFGNYLALNGLRSVKMETRKELLKRLLLARNFMDENYLSIDSIGEVALYCNMSTFHFFRSFRQAFGVTPYQYLLNKRLELARKIVSQKRMSITQTALHCNFPDIFTFSKAFKRRYGKSPSGIIV